MKKIIMLLCLVMAFSGCEKDDICVDEVTPQLVVEFYDISNPTVLKNVVNLKVTADGMTDALNTFNGVSKIRLPLKTNEDITRYRLLLNSNSSTAFNEDILEFNYTRENVYVSRACGFKTVFELNNTNGIFLSDIATPDGLWIQDTNLQTNSIVTENEVHLKIYF
ncbi:DUF6452 family protein [Flavobacterium sp.]|uniref:DUF6452 family protein n=1 Tax=Flavobacterium sp. TaxID=239 RepID=UPI0025CDBF52|nr:DUF6452 family protein [Flavobacterium sp.]